MNYYRVQPKGLNLPAHSSSHNGNILDGCFVFKSLKELYKAVKYWNESFYNPNTKEIVKIKSKIKVYDPGDIEGFILNDPKAIIIKRIEIDMLKVYENFPFMEK